MAGVHLKKMARVQFLFTCPSIPGAREPISVAILIGLLGKRGVIMEVVNVRNVRERWTRR
jgi:hypothetical protein